MGGASSKGAAAVGQAARSAARAGAARKATPPVGSGLPVEDDLLNKFKPTKGK